LSAPHPCSTDSNSRTVLSALHASLRHAIYKDNRNRRGIAAGSVRNHNLSSK